MKKVLVGAIILISCIAFVSGQSVAEDAAQKEIVLLTWQSGDPETSLIDVHLGEFESRTGINVNHTTMGFADLHTRIATLFASKSDAIDVFAAWKGTIQGFAKPGYIYDITDDLESEFIDGFTAALSSFIFNDRIYGLPYMQSFRMFYYNKELFAKAGFDPDKPPKTWDEVLTIAKATTIDSNGDGTVDNWGLLPTGIGDADNSVMDFALLYYLCGGGSLFDAENNPTFNSPAGEKALNTYKALYDADVIDPASWTIDSGNDRRARFIQGVTAMTIEWPSLWNKANNSAESKIQGKIGIAPIPAIDQIAGIGGDEGLAISAFSKNKASGLELLKFISGEEINRENTLRVGWLPVQKSLMEDPEVVNHPALKEMIKVALVQNQHFMARFATPYSNEVSNEALGVAIVDAVNGKISTSEALAMAEKLSKEIVAKYE